ncbi:MAG: hypothetical protein M1821_004750 [Bathelium mastoideum]|nr:MAG: hypothetical protein M1821_004750 [Bathelium mastoideum]
MATDQKPGEVKYEDRPIPKIANPYDVIVNVKYTGICGSDVHYWQHGSIGAFVVRAPMVLGHESAGVVHQVGSAVQSLKPGDHVAMEPGIPCRRCMRCKAGQYNLCADMAFAATPPFDGTLAKFYRLPEDFCYKLPEGMSLEEGALVEPTSVAVHVVRQAGIRPGQSVVVWGAGPVGLLCCAVARAFGASKIVSVDINEERLQFARKYAATHTFRAQRESANESAARLVKECELELGADAAIDATGAEPCIQTAIHALRVGGTYVQAGMGKPEITWPIGAMCAKELNVKGSFRYSSGDYQLAVVMISNGSVPVKELITGKVPFGSAEKAFQDVKEGKGIKTLIEGVQD